jgi:hypothetical protein
MTLQSLIERVEAAQAQEELVQTALRDAYQRDEIHYSVFSIADDMTTTRAAALSFQASALRARIAGGGDEVAL